MVEKYFMTKSLRTDDWWLVVETSETRFVIRVSEIQFIVRNGDEGVFVDMGGHERNRFHFNGLPPGFADEVLALMDLEEL